MTEPEHFELIKNIGEHDRTKYQNSYNVKHNGKYPDKGKASEEEFHKREKIIAIDLFNQSQKEGSIEHLGKILDYQTPLKGERKDPYGEIDLLSVNEKEKRVYILELKKNKADKKDDTSETLLRCILEAYTYYKLVAKRKLLDNFGLSAYEVEDIVIAPLVFKEDKQRKEWDEMMAGKRPKLRNFIDKLDVNVVPFFLESKGDNTYIVLDYSEI